MRLVHCLASVLFFPLAVFAQQPNIVPSDPLSPADERKAFTVPPGFEVQLVASEPDIDKPIQSAFDAKGRLWITTTRHYPFAADIGKGTDKLFVLSDFALDGKARKIETFANDLNIPIGVLPLPDCKSCILFSIPSVWKYTDTDGDGKADKKEELLTGFGYKDTHGLVNSFTLMPDGWVYATHGFSNTSVVKDRAGHTITMQSGNTFRFRPDGSNLEVFTRGQVNPFGMAVDPWFNLYTADCHSKPITQLIRGATYQSFSKPHDGLGYAPHVTQHGHNSTAICGLTWYDADHFPPEYRGNMFLGNVVTNRINADLIEWHGSTPVAKEKPDFLTSKDPWFRPTDVKLGPNGALFITDFYNRIIGHYEVPLTHPQRDKDRGRVWRVVWKGLDGKAPPAQKPFKDLTTEKVDRLVELLGHPNLTVRLLATHELIRRQDAVPASEQKSEVPSAHRAWVNEGLNRVGREEAKPGSSEGSVLAAHQERIRTARQEWQREHPSTNPGGLQPAAPPLAKLDPQVARATVDRMTAIPEAKNINPLVELLKVIPTADTHLKYAARVALRNSLRVENAWVAAGLLPKDGDGLPQTVTEETAGIVGDVTFALYGHDSCHFFAELLTKNWQPPQRTAEIVEFIANYGRSYRGNRLLDLITKFSDDPWDRLKLSKAMFRGLQTGGHEAVASERKFSQELVRQLADVSNPAVMKDCIEVIGIAKLEEETESVVKIASRPDCPEPVRAAAIEILPRLDLLRAAPALSQLLANPRLSAPLREKVATVLAGNSKVSENSLVADCLRDAMKTAPYRLNLILATGLAGNPKGADGLLKSVQLGEIPARLLQEKVVLDRLVTSKLPDLDKRVAELTKNLPPAEQRVNDLIAARSKAFAKAKPDKVLGAQLFTKHCAACHQINNVGGKVGPNLDGIGGRGHERLLEDILDPSRNVDGAFKARVLNLADGRTVTGLMLRVEGKIAVMADSEGKEVRVPTDDIEKNTVTNLSPMPANMDTALSEAEFFHLLAYLLDQRAKDGPPPKK